LRGRASDVELQGEGEIRKRENVDKKEESDVWAQTVDCPRGLLVEERESVLVVGCC
jgi:hypothetical protein